MQLQRWYLEKSGPNRISRRRSFEVHYFLARRRKSPFQILFVQVQLNTQNVLTLHFPRRSNVYGSWIYIDHGVLMAVQATFYLEPVCENL